MTIIYQWDLICPKCGVIATLPSETMKDDSWEWLDTYDPDAECKMPTQCCKKCKSVLDFEDTTTFNTGIPKGLSYLEGLNYAYDNGIEV